MKLMEKLWQKNVKTMLGLLLLPIFFALLYGCASISQLEQAPQPIKTEGSKGIEWQASYNDAVEIAKAKNKLLMLVFYGVSSKRLDENVFISPEVIKLAQEFVCVRLGSDQNELAKKYSIAEFPTVVFTDPRGGEYDRITGYRSASSFVSVLSKALIPIDVEYNVQLDRDRNLAIVNCRLKNIRQKSLIMYLWERSVKPSNISLSSTDGIPKWNEVSENFWQIDFNTVLTKIVTIGYEVPLNVLSSMDFNPAYISYVGEKYGILDGHVLFISPYNFHINGKIKVTLNLPDGWKALTTWEEKLPLNYSANYIQDVVDSVFSVGDFQSIERDINGKKVYAVYCGSVNIGSELERKADLISQIFKDYISRFGDFPFDKYMAIFSEQTPDGKYIHGTAHGAGFAGPIEMPQTFTSQFTAHEIFHVWNGRILAQKSQYEVWFKEGFTQYYGYITPYRVGLYGKEQFLYYLKSDYQEYLQKYEASSDIALARVNEVTARKEGRDQSDSIRNFIMYRKGALVASLFDDEISKATNGNKNLDDLIRYMIAEYKDKEYSSDDVLKSLNAITGGDFTRFFSDFIYGRTKLPFPEKLKPES